MQLSDREIQNTIDMLKKQRKAEGDDAGSVKPEEIEGMGEVVKQIGDAPEVRKEKVAKIKKALESSRYNVTGDDVAKKLIGRIFSDKIR